MNKKNIENCLNLTKECIEFIEKESYYVLEDVNIEEETAKVETSVYRINQKAHELKKAIEIYCS